MSEKEIGNRELGNGKPMSPEKEEAFRTCSDLRVKLVRIASIVNAALRNQPLDPVDCAVHLLEALERIGLHCPPKEPAAPVSALPEVPKADLKGLVGIRANKQHILAWSYTDSLDVRVTADETAPNKWDVFVSSNNTTRLQGCILGGRWLAMSLCKHLRNGMVSRRMKKHRLTANRQARKAAQKGEA